jgi:hypothetical protein
MRRYIIRVWEENRKLRILPNGRETPHGPESGMLYPGPDSCDFDDVRALNRAFLTLLRDCGGAERPLQQLPGELAKRLLTLSPGQTDRLAGVPFLVFSFREREQSFWDQLHTGEPRYDLFAECPPSADGGRLIAAGLGFAWQLARQNPYALRLVCGASLYWCEQLTERPLVDVISRACAHDDLLVLRGNRNPDLWQKLLSAGVDRSDRVRSAAHLSALQMLLTQTPKERARVWRSAACRSNAPVRSVADGNSGRRRGS